MQASVADTCSGTLQFCPELAVRVGGGATALAVVDIPFKPQHVPSDCGFNAQYERVSIASSHVAHCLYLNVTDS